MRDQCGRRCNGALPGSPVDTLLYIVYGTGLHYDEAVFSMLSALHHIGADRGRYRVVVYTDHPTTFTDLPVHTEVVSTSVFQDWSGAFGVTTRPKIFGIKETLRRFGGRVVFCDSDTFFTKHPKVAFGRVGPGRAVMHIGEYRLDDRCARSIADAYFGKEFSDRAGKRWSIGGRSLMFNSGVIGLDESDASVLDEVIHLCDQFGAISAARIPSGPGEPLPHLHPEQLSFSVCLRQHTKLRQSYDVVTHYWPPPARAAFHQHLARVLHQPGAQPGEQQFRELAAHAPHIVVRPFQWGRETIRRRIRRQIRASLGRMAQVIGVKEPLKQALHRVRRSSSFAVAEARLETRSRLRAGDAEGTEGGPGRR